MAGMETLSVQLFDDSLRVYLGEYAPADAERLNHDEVSRCAFFSNLCNFQAQDGNLSTMSLPVSERHFSQWRGYVTTQRVVPEHEMVQFESALTTQTVVAVLQVLPRRPRLALSRKSSKLFATVYSVLQVFRAILLDPGVGWVMCSSRIVCVRAREQG
jgi:hypothetical protein